MTATPELLDRLQGSLADHYRFDRERWAADAGDRAADQVVVLEVAWLDKYQGVGRVR